MTQGLHDRIQKVIPTDNSQINGITPVIKFGVQYGIYNICQFQWYGWCYFCEEGKYQLSSQKDNLNQVLGPANNKLSIISGQL